MKKIIALCLALLLSFSMVACGNSTTEDADTSEEQTNIVTESNGEADTETDADIDDGSSGQDSESPSEVMIGSTAVNFVGHFDTGGVYSTLWSMPAMHLCFDMILTTDSVTGEYYSEILEEYYWSEDDETLLVLTLRDDVYFSNGDQMTAEDMYYSLIERKVDTPAWSANAGLYIDAENSHVDENDPMTMYVKFYETYGPYEILLKVGVMNKSWIEENGGEDNFDWYDPAMVCGSGPYEVTEFTNDLSTTYELRDDWWYADEAEDGYCAVAKITCIQYSDSTTMMVDYQNGVLDAVLNLDATNVDKVVDANGGLGTAVTVNSNRVVNIVLGVDNNEIFDSINLRKAICYGVDAAAMTEAVYGSLGTVATSTAPASNQYYVAGHAYEYDLEAAQAALQDYFDETGTTEVTLTMIAGSSDSEMAELFQAYMEMVGITVDLQVYDKATAVTYFTADGGTDFMLSGGDDSNGDNEISKVYERFVSTATLTCCRRYGEEINDLIQSGLYTIDTDERAEIYAEIQDYFYNNYEMVPICEWSIGYAYNDTINSLSIVDVSSPNFRFMN